MPYNNLKSLVKSFGFTSLLLLCKEKGWRIPTLEEVRKHKDQLEYDVCWVSDIAPKKEDQETHALLYNVKIDKVEVCSKNHRHSSVVLKA